MRHSTPSEAQLLDLVRGLARELRPGAHGIDRLGLDHELERDFGLDSLARVELLARIERELGVGLAEAAFAEAETPRDLLRQMSVAGPAEAPAPAPAAMEEAVPEQPPPTLATLVELLDWHVAQHGERVHITLEDGAGQSEDISYRALRTEALALATGLVEHGLPLAAASGKDCGRPAPGPNAGDRVALDSDMGARIAPDPKETPNHSSFVIASAAKQSRMPAEPTRAGSPRPCRPRDDGINQRFPDMGDRAAPNPITGDRVAPDPNTGDRVAIMLPTGREFFAAFYGALYAGCVPVPLYPPARPSQIEEHMRRIAGIVANAGATLLITDARAKPLGHLLRAQCPSLRAVATVADLSRAAAAQLPPPPRPEDTAFLQYTSGSTGNPKGVVLSHANLLANLDAMARASGVSAKDVFVSWLPLYHDMGLIGACMGSLYVGFRLVLMSPLAFLARPGRWLWAIHRHRATLSAAPNFAYELCVNKLDERELDGLDLGRWRLAYNGAEPVSPDTLERFATRFAPYGLRADAMTPVYGLAESSVGLAFPPLGRGPLIDRVDRAELSASGIARPAPAEDVHAQRIVSCGLSLPGHAIRIVDADGRALPERTLGRVQFQGPSATRGYFRNVEANQALFDGGWLNTGDLGYLAAGELFLTGREKDVIIRGGHNLYPQELEEAVSRLPGVRPGGVVVFPATDAQSGTERLVVLAEIRDEKPANRARIQAEINGLAVDLIGMPADDIVLAPPRTVLKTSSGKVRRAACRERYERGELLGAQRPPWQQWLRLAGAGAVAQTRRRLGRAADAVWAAWAWAVYLAIVPLAWLLIAAVPGLGLRRRIARACARLALALTGLTPRLTGAQHLAGLDAPLIVVANHASFLDALILTAVLPPRFAYVAKQELLHKPLAAIPLRRLGSAFVERFDSARGVEDTRALEERLRAGESMVFFPEGTFKREPGLLPFRMGAFMLAARTGAPVLPVSLTGTRTLLRGESRRPHYSVLKVCIEKPISSAGEDWQAALQLRDSVRRQILAQLDEPDAAG
ncbi:MAG: AMP-binding protein [Thiobacillus sp.]|nr:AMP-binding protein [Thiobacillus sp.]